MKPFHHLRNLIRGSYWEGVLYALMVGTTESFALYFALKSGLSYTDLGLLSTLPIVFGSVSQWVIPQFVIDSNARPLKLVCYGIQVVGIFMIVAATRIAQPKILLFSGLSLYWIGGMSSGPLWLQWVSNEIPGKIFSIYFSKRNAFVSLITVVAYLATSFFLNGAKNLDRFVVAFIIGGIARVCGLAMQAWISRPGVSARNNPHFPQGSFLDNADSGAKLYNPDKIPIVEMFVFTVFFKIAANISSPYFLPYMIQDLKYSLIQYTFIAAIPFVGRFLFLANWGRSVDGVKPFIGLTLAGFLISVIPALWVTFPIYPYLLGFEVISGVMWGGFELCCLMVVRMKYGKNTLKPVALHLALMNIGATVGAKIGGGLLESGWSFPKLFYVSSILRFTITAAFLARISSLPITYQSIRAYGQFLSTVLSIRHPVAAVGRLLQVRRRASRRI